MGWEATSTNARQTSHDVGLALCEKGYNYLSIKLNMYFELPS